MGVHGVFIYYCLKVVSLMGDMNYGLLFQVFAIVRDQADPQQFSVEYVKGAIRTYTSTDRFVFFKLYLQVTY